MSVNDHSNPIQDHTREHAAGSVPPSVNTPASNNQVKTKQHQNDEAHFRPNNGRTRMRARINDDEQMMQLFAAFQAARHELADSFVRCRIIRHSHYNLKNEERPLNCLVFGSMAGDFTRGLIGEVNRFLINLHQADSWVRAIRSCEEAKRAGLLWEFADPLLELSVSRLYSLKNQFIFAAVHLIHQANSRKQQNWKDDLPPDKQIDYKVLAKIGAGWSTFPKFIDALQKLNDDKFKLLTKNFRHLLHHRFRLQLGEGLTPYFDRQQTAIGTTYTYRVSRPLQLNNLIPCLYKQHQRAADVFFAYWQLLNELNAVWPVAKSTRGRPPSLVE